MLKHETIPDYRDAHVFQIFIFQKWSKLSGNFMFLKGFEIGAKPSLSKERAKLMGVPFVIVAQVVVSITFTRHTPIVTACAPWCRHCS